VPLIGNTVKVTGGAIPVVKVFVIEQDVTASLAITVYVPPKLMFTNEPVLGETLGPLHE
jgi:hypothetical protein